MLGRTPERRHREVRPGAEQDMNSVGRPQSRGELADSAVFSPVAEARDLSLPSHCLNLAHSYCFIIPCGTPLTAGAQPISFASFKEHEDEQGDKHKPHKSREWFCASLSKTTFPHIQKNQTEL